MGVGRAWLNSATNKWHDAARADFAGHCFMDDANFSGFVFPGYADFGPAKGKDEAGKDIIVLTRFEKDARFDKATFSGFAWFDDATFSGVARFSKATFSWVAWFGNATFSGFAWFGEATFSGDAWFDKSTFSGDAGFYKATFSGVARFQQGDVLGEGGVRPCPLRRPYDIRGQPASRKPPASWR